MVSQLAKEADRYKSLSGVWTQGTKLNRGSQGAAPLHSPGLQGEHGGVVSARISHVFQDVHYRYTSVEVVPALCHFIHPHPSHKHNLFSPCPYDITGEMSMLCCHHLNLLWESVSISTIRSGQPLFLRWFASLPNNIPSQRN